MRHFKTKHGVLNRKAFPFPKKSIPFGSKQKPNGRHSHELIRVSLAVILRKAKAKKSHTTGESLLLQGAEDMESLFLAEKGSKTT